MKKFFSCSVLMFLLATAAAPTWAGTTAVFKAKVSGSVRTQLLITPVDGRIESAPLNNKRIFDEFGVSPDDYELVLTLSGDISVLLMPKSLSSGLPSVNVFTVHGSSIVDTHKNTIGAGGSLTSGATTNLFKDLAGELQGAIKFKGAILSPQFTKVTLDGHARGTGLESSVALLTIKLSTGATFVPGP